MLWSGVGAGAPGSAAPRARLALRQASQKRGFTLQYQPILALRDGRLAAMQAQLRWPRRRDSAAPTGARLKRPLEHGLAASTAAWMLHSACQAACAWPDTAVSVTLGGSQPPHAVLLDQVAQALDQSRLPADRLEIALPANSLAADDDEAMLTLAALRDLGVAVAMEGFGGAAACLLALQRQPFTAVKLDRCLVRDLPDGRNAAALAHAAIEFAHAMGLMVVAAGLETAAQLAWLRRAQCDQAQGSLCGAPMPASAVAAFRAAGW